MSTDEHQIREVVTSWLEATKAGDVEGVLKLMADDVVFLAPGQPPMRKADFAAAAASQGREGGPKIDGTSEIQEIKVLGDWAFLWTRLKVTVTPPNGAAPIVRSGYTLSILQKQDGKWLLARDANLLTVAGS